MCDLQQQNPNKNVNIHTFKSSCKSTLTRLKVVLPIDSK